MQKQFRLSEANGSSGQALKVSLPRVPLQSGPAPHLQAAEALVQVCNFIPEALVAKIVEHIIHYAALHSFRHICHILHSNNLRHRNALISRPEADIQTHLPHKAAYAIQMAGSLLMHHT